MQPTPGRIVLWRHDTGIDFPAIVTMTEETWKDTPPESDGNPTFPKPDPGTIHLSVFIPLGNGCGFAYNVPEDATKDAEVPPGSWRWPPRS